MKESSSTNHTRTRRGALQTAPLALSVPLIAACSAGGAPAPPGAPSRPAVTLEYWSRFASPAAELEDTRVREWGEQNGPTRFQKTVNSEATQEKLETAIAAGSSPDVYSMGSVATYAGLGATLVVERMAAVQRELADYHAFLANRCKWEGKLHGVPYVADVRAMIYRKDAMREAGLDPERFPDTWEGLRDAARRLVKWDGDALARSGFNVPKTAFPPYDLFLVMHDQMGEPAYDSTDAPKRARFNGPNGRAALQFLVDLVNRDRVDAIEQPRPAPGANALVAGLQAATWEAPGVINAARRTAPDQLPQLGVAVTPRWQKRLTFAGGSYLSAAKGTKGPEAAADFMVFLTGGPNGKHAAEISTVTNSIPARKSAATSEYVKDPLIKPFFDSIEHGRANIIHAQGATIRAVMVKEFEAAIRLQKGVQAALDDALRGAQELLDRA